jgi:hypothetical protein
MPGTYRDGARRLEAPVEHIELILSGLLLATASLAVLAR